MKIDFDVTSSRLCCMGRGEFTTSSGVVLRSLDVLLCCLLVLIRGRILLILRGSKTVWNLGCRQLRNVCMCRIPSKPKWKVLLS